MPLTVGEAFIKIRPDLSKVDSEIALGMQNALGNVVSGLGKDLQSAGLKMMGKFGVGLGIALAANITQFQQLDSQIRETLTLLGGTSDDVFTARFDEMQEGIRDLSREVGVLEQGISEGLYQALSAGIPRSNVFSFLETAQKAAIGGNIDLLTAVDGLTTAVNSFEAQNLTAAEAADIMFKTVARGKTTFDQLSRDMAKVAPLVASTGTSFEEFMAIIATMTLSGTRTSEAFTGVRASLTGLLRPSEEMTEIWNDYGFASGDAAVASVGLQGAMSLLAKATGGSVSQLIKLLGGAEAANAVLQVTGDNTERFESVLRSTSEAAGAANEAFEIMQEGTGRSFGRMAAAFDRLGNAGGDLADNFVTPIVDGVTRAVSSIADFTAGVGEFIEPVADAFRGLIETITGNRVFTTIATGIAAIVVAFGSFQTILGGVTVAVGGLILALGWFLQTTFLGKMKLLSGAVQFFGTRITAIGTQLTTATNPALRALGTRFEAAGAGFSKFATLLKPGPLIAVSVAIGAIVAGGIKLRELNQTWADSGKILTLQTDLLTDSLGGQVEAIRDLRDESGNPIVNSIVFAAENEEFLDELRRTRREFGEDAARDLILSVAMRMVDTGNSPEEAIGLIEKLASQVILGFKVDFDAGDLTFENELEALTTRARTVFQDVENSGGLFGDIPFFNKELRETRGRIEDLATATAAFFVTSEGSAESLELIGRIGEIFNEDAEAAFKFGEAFSEAFEEITGRSLDLVAARRGILEGRDPFAAILEQIEKFLPKSTEAQRKIEQLYETAYAPTLVQPPPLLNQDLLDQLEAGFELPDALVFRARFEFNEEERNAYDQLVKGIEAAWEQAADFIKGKQDEIFENFESQVPLLGQYGGALDQTFADWLKAQNEWQADFELVEETLADLAVDLGPELANRIKELPLDQKAWLAKLQPKEFEQAVTELNESWSLVTEAAEDEWLDQLPGVIAEAGALFNEEYDILEADASKGGVNVAREFGNQFRNYSRFWEDIARTRARNIESILGAIWSGRPPILEELPTDPGVPIYNGYNVLTGRFTPPGGGGGGGGGDININGDINVTGSGTTTQSVEQAVANGVITAFQFGVQ